MLPSHDRFKYSGIKSRPKFAWPDNKRLAVYIAVNIEHFPYGVQCGVDLDRQTQPWSQRSWLWREYGNRIGEWRLIELFDELKLNVGVIVNTENYEHCPDLIQAHRDRGDEMIAHGRSNAERQIEMDERTEKKMIDEVTASMKKADGKRPQGWLSPYLTPSLVTTDLLVQAGYSYVLDWGICDEQPFWVSSRTKPILAVPYPIELNDSQHVIHRKGDAESFCDMITEQAPAHAVERNHDQDAVNQRGCPGGILPANGRIGHADHGPDGGNLERIHRVIHRSDQSALPVACGNFLGL